MRTRAAGILEKHIVMGVSVRHFRNSSRRLALKRLAVRRKRAATAAVVPNPPQTLHPEDLATFGNASLRAQLADRLGDAMWAIEEAIAICEIENDASRDTSWIEPDLRDTFDQVNGLMKTITN
jgi:hypothetical protein